MRLEPVASLARSCRTQSARRDSCPVGGCIRTRRTPTSVSVDRLLAGQFPQWTDLPLRPVASAGTDNALDRLGDGLVVRLPRIHWAVGDGTRSGSLATELAQFVAALHRIHPMGGPPASRGGPLASGMHRPAPRLTLCKALSTPPRRPPRGMQLCGLLSGPRPPVWVHGDLSPGNLPTVDGRLSAVIDFGVWAVGDPACDLRNVSTPASPEYPQLARAWELPGGGIESGETHRDAGARELLEETGIAVAPADVGPPTGFLPHSDTRRLQDEVVALVRLAGHGPQVAGRVGCLPRWGSTSTTAGGRSRRS